MRKGLRCGNICVGLVFCVIVGRDQNYTISCSWIFKINFKLCTYIQRLVLLHCDTWCKGSSCLHAWPTCYVEEISCGVPQGSGLGPILFVLCTTPLSTVIERHSILHHSYADDTQL